VYQLGEFSSVKKKTKTKTKKQASQDLDCLLVIKGFAFQAVKKKKKDVSYGNLGDSFSVRKVSGFGTVFWGREKLME
jgi:hypothetical protein